MRNKTRDEFGNPIDPALVEAKEEYRRTHQSDIAPQGKPLGGLSALDDMLGNPSSIPRKEQKDAQVQMENTARMNAAKIREGQRKANPERQISPQEISALATQANQQRMLAAEARASSFRDKMLRARELTGVDTAPSRFNELRKKLR